MTKGVYALRKRAFVAALLCLFLSQLALADVTYEEETKMGGILKIATFGKGMKTKTRIRGNRMRSDSGNNATIIDLDEEKIYQLDKKKKAYTVMTFDEKKEQLRAAMAQARSQAAEAEGGKDTPDVTASAEVKVTETGKTEKIRGHECKQYLMELDITMTNEDEDESGTMSTVTEMWLAKDIDGLEELQAFHRKMAEKLGTASLARGLMSSGSPEGQRFGMDMGKMMDEMRKMDGFPMRSVFYFGSPEAAKREASGEKKEGGGFGGMFKKMSGLPGMGKGDEEGAETEGAVVMKMTTETKKWEAKPIDPKVFAIPDNYTLEEAR